MWNHLSLQFKSRIVLRFINRVMLDLFIRFLVLEFRVLFDPLRWHLALLFFQIDTVLSLGLSLVFVFIWSRERNTRVYTLLVLMNNILKLLLLGFNLIVFLGHFFTFLEDVLSIWIYASIHRRALFSSLLRSTLVLLRFLENLVCSFFSRNIVLFFLLFHGLIRSEIAVFVSVQDLLANFVGHVVHVIVVILSEWAAIHVRIRVRLWKFNIFFLHLLLYKFVNFFDFLD